MPGSGRSHPTALAIGDGDRHRHAGTYGGTLLMAGKPQEHRTSRALGATYIAMQKSATWSACRTRKRLPAR